MRDPFRRHVFTRRSTDEMFYYQTQSPGDPIYKNDSFRLKEVFYNFRFVWRLYVMTRRINIPSRTFGFSRT